MSDIFRLGINAGEVLLLISLASARLTPLLQIVPFLGSRHLTGMVRSSLAFAMAVFMIPWLYSTMPKNAEWSLGFMAPLLAKEVALGTIFGFLSSLAFYAASGIGFLVDSQRGGSNAQMSDALSGEEMSPMGSMMFETLTMIFIASGGLALFFQAILTTYAFWPPFSFWPQWSAGPLQELVLGHFTWYMTTVVTLAAPMLLVCFLVDFGMGLMNRFAPQLNVFFLAMPVKSGLVMALMIVYWAAMFRVLRGDVLRLPVLWDALRQAMGGGSPVGPGVL